MTEAHNRQLILFAIHGDPAAETMALYYTPHAR